MKLKNFLAIFAIILVFIIATATNVYPQQITQYTYSDFLSKDKTLTWEVSTMEGYDTFALFNNYQVHKNDIVKLKILKDLNSLQLTDEIWNYSKEKWAELYVNDVLVTSEPSEMNFSYGPLEYGMFLTFITPVQVTHDNGHTEFYYDMLLDQLRDYEFEKETDIVTEYFRLDYTRKFFIMKYEYNVPDIDKITHTEIAIIQNKISIEYDTATGVLASFDLLNKVLFYNEIQTLHFVFKSTTPGIYAGFENIIPITTLVVIGILSLRHKRKEAKNKGYSVKDLL